MLYPSLFARTRVVTLMVLLQMQLQSAVSMQAHAETPTSTPTLTATPTLPDACLEYRDAVIASQPVAYWKLDEADGTAAADETGMHPGTYFNNPTLGAPGPLANVANRAVSFDQANDYLLIPDSPALRLTGSFALELWLKSNSLSQVQRYFLSRGNMYAVLYEYTPAELSFFQSPYSGRICNPGFNETLGGISLVDTEWHHIVYSYEATSGTWRGYKDGALVFNSVCDFSLLQLSSPLIIGAASASANNVDGQVDEVAVYAHALSPEEVQTHFAAASCGAPSPTPSPLGNPTATATPTLPPVVTFTPTPTVGACGIATNELLRYALASESISPINVGAESVVNGDLCAAAVRFKQGANIQGTTMATRPTGTAITVGAQAIIGSDMVTGGGKVSVQPNAHLGGSTNTSGSDSRVIRCAALSCELNLRSQLLRALPADQVLGPVRIPAHSTGTIELPSVNGARVVIDIASIAIGRGSVLRVVGDNQQAIFRVSSRLRFAADSRLELVGLRPEDILFLVNGSLGMGRESVISGSVYADRIRVGKGSTVGGALFSRRGVHISPDAIIWRTPFQGW